MKMNELELNNKETMTSLEISELTSKRHDHVKTDISKLYNELGDTPKSGEVYNHQNQMVKVFKLQRRECDLLMMGYSIATRAKVYDRWLELEKKKQKQLTPAEQFLQLAQLNVETERKITEQESRIKALEDKQQDGNTGFLTILAYCRMNNIPEPLKQAQKHGKRAVKLSEKYNILIGKVSDERWGQVNSYHIDVLNELFGDL